MQLRTYCVLLLASALSACQGSTGTTSGEPPHYPAPNLADDDYRAREGWELVWSDEFEGATIDASNWNRQGVEAGRFNDE